MSGPFAVSPGYVWPDSGTTEPSAVGDVFGPRPFSAHVSTVGYDYDFHRGIDLPITQGEPVYSPLDGFITRRHYTHFQWEFEENLSEFTASGDLASFSVSGDALQVAWTAVPTVSSTGFADATTLICRTALDPTTDDCDVQLELASVVSTSGDIAVGVCWINAAGDEWAAMDHDGSTITTFAVDADGADVTNDGNTAANADATWLRVFYDQSATNLLFQRGTDGDSWTTVGTWSAPNWTISGCPAMHFGVYVRKTSTSTAANTGTLAVNFIGGVDNENIGRFGNWVQIARAGEKWLVLHMEHIAARMGRIGAGQIVGYAGNTGFDSRSGRVINTHAHVEYIDNSAYIYDNDDPMNPLASGLLPRADVSNNVSVTRSDANDPNADACFRLAITVTRADQDFDMNAVSLTGNLATRTINWDTRAGLNADTDVPDQDGVYLVASDFDTESSSYSVDVYFQKSVVGSTFASAAVTDCNGVTLWSE